MTANWLHVSDFHFKSGDPYDRDVVLRALVHWVAEFRKRGRHPDLIFATGDVAHSGQEAEYRPATQFFDALCGAADIDRRRLYVIPGNHDVDRNLGVGLARTLGTREEADTYFGPSIPKPHITQKQHAFQQWYNQYFDGIRTFPQTSSCGPVEVVEIGRLRVGILPINSALFCQGDDDHAKLWIGRRSLDAAVEEMKKLGASLKVALLHHPLDWLHEAERSNVRTVLQSNVDIILRGHLHETDVEGVAGVTGNVLHMAAGATYQTPRWPNRVLYASLQDDQIEVSAFRYEDQPREIWTIDPSLFPEPPYTRTFSIPRAITHSPSLSGIRIGENIAAASRIIGFEPVARNQMGPQTIMKWRFPVDNELSVTAITDTGRIVFIECDWGGDSRLSLTDFPGLQFGITTLAEIREKFGSNGFTFDKNPMAAHPDGVVLSNNFQIIGTNTICIFITKILHTAFQKLKNDELMAIANHARLVAIILADGTYLDSTWGKRTADPAYRPIDWK
jgi:3',5'-cyclic AMP phosphodiesterase CpdA